jgi:small conductance mechanosensitive channel
VDSTLLQLVSLLLLGICLGCHYLLFRRPARKTLNRSLQQASKLRLLGVAILLPFALFLNLNGQTPLLALLCEQALLYAVGSTFIEMAWVYRQHRQNKPRDIRQPLRWGWIVALFCQAGWSDPAYRELAQASLATALCWWILLALHKLTFDTPRSRNWQNQLQAQLRNYGLLASLALTGYYLLRAWTVVPISSGHLALYEKGLILLLALSCVEILAVALESLLRSRQRSAEVSHLAADSLRAVLYGCLAAGCLALIREQDFSLLALSSAFFSMALGFALKPSLGNFIAGLVTSSTQDLCIGDFVSIDQRFGLILKIDWRSLTLGTNALDSVTITHRQVAGSLIVNYSRPTPQHACYLQIRLPAELAPGMVRKTLLEIFEKIPEVASTPEPEVYLMNLEAHSSTFQVRWWLDHIGNRPPHESSVRRQVIYGLERSHLRPMNISFELITASLPDTLPELDK